MWMSFGGMIGGIAAGLVAPYVFNWIAEYPILITLAVLCRPGLTWPKTTWQQIIVFGSIVLAVARPATCSGNSSRTSTSRPTTRCSAAC